MTGDKEAVEHAERNRGHSEEIHGRNCFPMVSEEGQPALAPLRVSRRSFHPTEDGSLGNSKLSMRSSPWIRGAPHVGFSTTSTQEVQSHLETLTEEKIRLGMTRKEAQ